MHDLKISHNEKDSRDDDLHIKKKNEITWAQLKKILTRYII